MSPLFYNSTSAICQQQTQDTASSAQSSRIIQSFSPSSPFKGRKSPEYFSIVLACKIKAGKEKQVISEKQRNTAPLSMKQTLSISLLALVMISSY